MHGVTCWRGLVCFHQFAFKIGCDEMLLATASNPVNPSFLNTAAKGGSGEGGHSAEDAVSRKEGTRSRGGQPPAAPRALRNEERARQAAQGGVLPCTALALSNCRSSCALLLLCYAHFHCWSPALRSADEKVKVAELTCISTPWVYSWSQPASSS